MWVGLVQNTMLRSWPMLGPACVMGLAEKGPVASWRVAVECGTGAWYS